MIMGKGPYINFLKIIAEREKVTAQNEKITAHSEKIIVHSEKIIAQTMGTGGGVRGGAPHRSLK